jgi:hypothetical protein
MKIAIAIATLLLLNGCAKYTEGQAACRAVGPNWDYNGVADRCIDWSQPLVPMNVIVPYMQMNAPGPSSRYTAPPITVPPMNRCQSLVIGNQIQTTCY